jgi:hypothetical protein
VEFDQMVLKMRQSRAFEGATGQGLNEYGLILGVVVILAIPGLMLLGNQSKGGVDAVNANSNEMKDMVNVLNNQTPGGQSLVSQPNGGNLTSPLIDIDGQPVQFQLNQATGLVEPFAGNGGFTEQNISATNTTSVDGLQQKVLDDIKKDAPLLAELGLGSDFEKVLAATQSFRPWGKETTGSNGGFEENPITRHQPGAEKGPAVDANPGFGTAPGGGTGTGTETTGQGTFPRNETNSLAALFGSFDLNKPLTIRSTDIHDLSTLQAEDQAWFNQFFTMQSSTLSIINNPTLIKTNPALVDRLKLNLQMTFYNQLLPTLKTSPTILTAALGEFRPASRR